jgi:hypothetical protein
MPPIHLRAALVCACLGVSLAGCARDVVVLDANHPQGAMLQVIPLSLRGQNTTLHLEFPKGRQTIEPGQFTQSEVCYLKAGSFRIDCYPEGSELNLGPTDSTDLLTDHAAWNLSPENDENKAAVQAMQAYAVITLIAGSVDRLPTALSDYLQNPGQHLTEALELTSELLSQQRVKFHGFAKGGNFTVTVELNDDGRDKLLDALDQVGDSQGGVQLVRLSNSRTTNYARVVGSASHLKTAHQASGRAKPAW